MAALLPHDVAHAVETIGSEGLGLLFRRPVVALDRIRTARHQLARFAVGHLVAIVVEHLDLIVRADRHAGTAEQHVLGGIQRHHVDQTLGGAVDFLRRAAEALAQARAQFRGETRAAVLDHPKR